MVRKTQTLWLLDPSVWAWCMCRWTLEFTEHSRVLNLSSWDGLCNKQRLGTQMVCDGSRCIGLISFLFHHHRLQAMDGVGYSELNILILRSFVLVLMSADTKASPRSNFAKKACNWRPSTGRLDLRITPLLKVRPAFQLTSACVHSFSLWILRGIHEQTTELRWLKTHAPNRVLISDVAFVFSTLQGLKRECQPRRFAVETLLLIHAQEYADSRHFETLGAR